MDFSLGVNEVITSATPTDQVRHLAYDPPMSQFSSAVHRNECSSERRRGRLLTVRLPPTTLEHLKGMCYIISENLFYTASSFTFTR